MVSQKSVLLIIGGGIAAYKCLELIRQLSKRGYKSRVILTKSGAEFVTPLSLAALSGNKVYTDLFSLTDETEMGHIELSRSSELVLVAPATADLMAKMANGLANDLASTALLATDKPVMIAPAMNVRMWEHPGTQRNLKTLIADGIAVIGPDEGDMACGEFGPGRMSEPAQIADRVDQFFGRGSPKPLAGKKMLVTAGPTHEPIDPVRYIANRSSGKQGYAIATALAQLGADVTLISGPTKLECPNGVTRVDVQSANDMLAAMQKSLPADAAIFAAAVADWRVANAAGQKIKKVKGELPTLSFTENPDILASISKLEKNRPQLVVGFAAETENVVENGTSKLARKGCDWIVANDVSPESGTFGGDNNQVHLIKQDAVDEWPKQSKEDVAQQLAACISEYFSKEQ